MSATTDPTLPVARDLTEIERLTTDLDTQAAHSGVDSDAMVQLAPVANLEAWENLIEHAETTGLDTSHVSDHDDEWEPCLQSLLFWSERWRVEHGREMDGRPTIGTEAAFLRSVMQWAYDNEPRWDDYAADVRRARVRLENTLRAGARAERSRVPCSECAERPMLIKVYGDRAADDHHKCPACKHKYDGDAFGRAYAKQLRSEGAERWVRSNEAVGTLRALGRPERTIRKWFETCEVHAYCEPSTRQVYVWWPDLWRLHLTTATRRRVA